MPDKKICFVIAPIGEAETDTRRRSDQILKHVISPAVNECGYDAIRADQISEPGIITSQVIQHVVDDPLVVADLTERNPNVFYELALRHAIQKPLVQIIRKGEPLPFDVAGTRTITLDHRDLDSVEGAKKEIINQVRAAENSTLQIDTPISVALNLQLLKQSDNPERRSLADMLSAISEIRTIIASIEKRISRAEGFGSREFSSAVRDYILHEPAFSKFVIYDPAGSWKTNTTIDQVDQLEKYLDRLKLCLKEKSETAADDESRA